MKKIRCIIRLWAARLLLLSFLLSAASAETSTSSSWHVPEGGQVDDTAYADLPIPGYGSCDLPLSSESEVLAATIVENARSLVGKYPYVYGGESPEEGGFDCTGLVWYVYNQMSGLDITLAQAGRSKAALAAAGERIYDHDEFLPGDVIQFTYAHVAIYVGDGRVVHARTTGTYIMETDLSYENVEYAVRYPGVVQQASLASGSIGSDLRWILRSSGELLITGSGPIPDFWDELSAPWSEQRSSVVSVILDEQVTAIGDYAFYGCENLTNLVIPEQVTSIGNYAFCGCSSLNTISYTGTLEQWNLIDIGVDNENLTAASLIYELIAPTLTVTTDESGKPFLTWTDIEGTIGYEVWGATGSGDFVRLLTTADTTWTHDTADAGMRFHYMVRAIAEIGESPFSEVQTITCLSEDDLESLTGATGSGILSYLSVSDVGAEVTRLEFVKLMAGLADLTPLDDAVSFTDCDDLTELDLQLIAAILAQGWIVGYGDGTFRPNQTISRAEAAVILYRYDTGDLPGSQAVFYTDCAIFADVSKDAWYAGYVNYCANAGYIGGYEGGAFCPGEKAVFRDTLRWLLNIVNGAAAITLSAPTLQITDSTDSGEITLTWNTVSGAEIYEIWRSVDGGAFTLLCETAETTYTDATTPGTPYCYRIRAIAGDVLSIYSTIVTFHQIPQLCGTLPPEVPPAPSDEIIVDDGTFPAPSDGGCCFFLVLCPVF